jgi:peptide/nickel transport system substrate-binding protein
MKCDRQAILACIITAGLFAASTPPSLAQQPPLRVGMTASDIPATTGQPDQGTEGIRFLGITVYDALVNWKLNDPGIAPTIVPGLATEWRTDEKDRTKWIFKLRHGVKFHDGSDFNADAVIWNLDKLFNKASPQHDPKQQAQASGRIYSLKSWRKIDDYTVELTTLLPDAAFLGQLVMVFYSSPAQWEKVGRDWAKFALQPSGTGPFRVEKVVLRERVELVRNAGYWDKSRIPKSERVVLLPIPEPTTRASALLAGQIDFVESPPPDYFPQFAAKGFKVTSLVYPHMWPYFMSFEADSPWSDVRVRKAVNLAIDREGLVKLLDGHAVAARGVVDPSSPWFGKPKFQIKYDPEQARKLLAEAGYTKDKPLTLKVGVSPSGSGQMVPLPMNEFIQQSLKNAGINLEIVVFEWEALRTCRRAGAGAPQCRGVTGINHSSATLDEGSTFKRVYHSTSIAPKGWNFGKLKDPVLDKMIDDALAIFDTTKRNQALAKVHEYIVDNAIDVWIVHDAGARAMSPKVKGWVQVRNWLQDLTPVYVEK